MHMPPFLSTLTPEPLHSIRLPADAAAGKAQALKLGNPERGHVADGRGVILGENKRGARCMQPVTKSGPQRGVGAGERNR